MRYGVESWWIYFVWCSDSSFHGIGMPFDRDPKSGIKIFTHNIYTQGKKLKLKLFDSLLIAHPQHCCRIPLLFHSDPKGALCHAFIWRE
jgi:hypothetical protein